MGPRWWRENSGVLFPSSLPLTSAEPFHPSCETGQAGESPALRGSRAPSGWVTQRQGGLPTPSVGPFHQGLCLWNVAGPRMGPNKGVLFSPKKEKKDKFLQQALTGTDENYRNQCGCHGFLSPLYPYLAGKAWSPSLPSLSLHLRP